MSASQMDPLIPITLSCEVGPPLFDVLNPASPQLDSGTRSAQTSFMLRVSERAGTEGNVAYPVCVYTESAAAPGE